MYINIFLLRPMKSGPSVLILGADCRSWHIAGGQNMTVDPSLDTREKCRQLSELSKTRKELGVGGHVWIRIHIVVCYLVTKSRLTLCDPVDCSPPGSSVHGISQARIQVGCHFLPQRIFPTQRSNPPLLHCQMCSLPLSYLGSLVSI